MQCWSEAVHGQSVYAYCSRKRGLTPSARAASFAQEGLRSSGRPRKTASAFSWAMSALACSGELMRPTAAVRVRLSARTAAALRVWYSSSWGDRHHVDAARGAVDEIDAPLGRPPGELHGLGEGPRLPGVVGVLLDPVGGRDAQEDRLVS